MIGYEPHVYTCIGPVGIYYIYYKYNMQKPYAMHTHTQNTPETQGSDFDAFVQTINQTYSYLSLSHTRTHTNTPTYIDTHTHIHTRNHTNNTQAPDFYAFVETLTTASSQKWEGALLHWTPERGVEHRGGDGWMDGCIYIHIICT
jgi:hypothetical protein